ncbi:MAG: septum formation initiator family protein [Candidatus Caldatribacteriaceae bacterium]
MRRVRRLLGGALFFFFFMAMLYLGMQALVLEKSFQVAQKKALLESLLAEKERLETEVANLSSLERIRTLAEERLGMVSPTRVVYVVVGKEVLGESEAETQVALHPGLRKSGHE